MAEQQQIQCPHCGQAYTVPGEQVGQYLGQTIVCQNCRQAFSVHGTAQRLEASAVATGLAAQAGQPVDYASPTVFVERTDGMSVAALITGIAALFIPIIAGIIAIVLGSIGLKRTADPRVGGRGFAIAGLTLGIVGLFFSIFVTSLLVAILLPSLGQARETAHRVRCASNMRQIGLAIMMYQNENQDLYPPNLEAVLLTQDLTAEVFICPSSNDTRAPGATVEQQAQNLSAGGYLSFVYVRPAERGRDVADPANTIILYEPLTNHGRDGGNFLYADAHVEFHSRARAEQLINEIEARGP